MLDKRISKKVRLKNIDKTRKCLIEKSKTTWFNNEYKTQKVCIVLNYIEQTLNLVSTIILVSTVMFLFPPLLY